jgi:hypothetical protein
MGPPDTEIFALPETIGDDRPIDLLIWIEKIPSMVALHNVCI